MQARAALLPLVLAILASVPAHGELAEPLARLLEPVDGSMLVAGELAWLVWEPAEMARHPAIVEWEAFLSLDGGVSYPFQITPHLSTSERRVLFRVPAFPSREARILLRFGDEREERGLETEARFAIHGDATARMPRPDRWASRRGDPARPGERGTVFWEEGDRQGRVRRLVEASREGLVMDDHTGPGLWGLAFGVAPLRHSPRLLPPVATELHHTASFEDELAFRPPQAPRSKPLLSLLRRLNT